MRQTEQDFLTDIKQMLLIISSFTEPFSEGEKLLEEWQIKYGLKSTIKQEKTE